MKLTKTYNETIEVPAAGEFFESIYESVFPKVARYIHQSGGVLDDAKDTFHDALVIYYEKYVKGNLQVEKSAEAYILGIARHLWLRKTGRQFYDSKAENGHLRDIPPEPTLNEHKLLKFLEIAGKKCLHLLHRFYYEHMDMKEIAVELDYSTGHSASVQKYKCIEKIRKEIQQKSMTYEDFFD